MLHNDDDDNNKWSKVTWFPYIFFLLCFGREPFGIGGTGFLGTGSFGTDVLPENRAPVQAKPDGMSYPCIMLARCLEHYSTIHSFFSKAIKLKPSHLP